VSNYKLVSIVFFAVMSSLSSVDHAIADELNPGYEALNDAVLEGKDVRMLIDLSMCQIHGTVNSGPSIKGVMRFDGFMIHTDGTIAFAATHFTVRPDKSPATEFLSFRVHVDGKIEAHTIVLNAATFAILQDTTFDCEIGKGAAFHW
jgi:hypothetical protein